MDTEKNNIIDTNAQASAFGWDFQSSLALFLIADDIANLKHVKVEGKTEDIELVYKDGSNVFIQSKSQLNPYSTSNSNKHLKNGIKTLINASQKNEYSHLLYGTNISNPFVLKKFAALFSGGPTNHSFNELPIELKNKTIKIVNKVAKEEKLSLANFDYNRFSVITLPFYGDDDNTRYRFVKEKILYFLDKIGLNGIQSNKIFNNFLFDFTKNPVKSINIEKEDLAWSIIIFALDTNNDEFFEEFDLDIAEEDAIQNIYTNFIERKSLEFTLLTEVRQNFIELYSSGTLGTKRGSTVNFINKTAEVYEKKLFYDETTDLTLAVTKFILWKILKKRKIVERISKEIGL